MLQTWAIFGDARVTAAFSPGGDDARPTLQRSGDARGNKVIRVLLKDGVPTGEYADFMTGFVVNDSSVWARPVGVAVAHDGALLVSEDGNGTM